MMTPKGMKTADPRRLRSIIVKAAMKIVKGHDGKNAGTSTSATNILFKACKYLEELDSSDVEFYDDPPTGPWIKNNGTEPDTNGAQVLIMFREGTIQSPRHPCDWSWDISLPFDDSQIICYSIFNEGAR